MAKMPLGYVGLGAMGLPMTANLLKAGYPVAVFDVNAKAVEAAAALGARPMPSAAAVAAASEAVLVCVPNNVIVERVFFGADGIAAGNADGKARILIDLSSSKAATSRRIAEAMRAAGGDFLDTPVSGGVGRARTGELAILVGGRAETLAKVRPVLETLGRNIFPVGEVGAGNLAKGLNNILSAGNVAMLAEALLVGAKHGIAPAALARAAEHSLAPGYAMEKRILPEVLGGRFQSAFKMGLMYKDVAYAAELALEARRPLLVAGLTRDLCAAGVAAYGDDGDYVRIVNVLERWESGANEVFGPG